jgi:hypothetical protein
VDDAEQHRMEVMKAHFDLLKHVTTLDTASALIVVTVSKELNATLALTTTALLLFGISLLLSVFGMLDVNANRYGWFRRSDCGDPYHDGSIEYGRLFCSSQG